jgi:hypothetical protein
MRDAIDWPIQEIFDGAQCALLVELAAQYSASQNRQHLYVQ